MNEQIVSRLTGLLTWKANNTQLLAFQKAMQNVSRQMNEVGKNFDALQRKLNTKLKIDVQANTAAREKASAQLRRSLDRELKLEMAASKAKQAAFAAELGSQKLAFASKRESAFFTTAAIKDRQQLAILAAKEANADAQKLKAQGLALKNEDNAVQLKARQLRIEAIHTQQAQRTLNLQAQQQKTLTATQRIEQALIEARARGQRQVQAFSDRQAASKARSTRQDERARQQDAKHGWAVQRHETWLSNRNKPEAPTGFLGLGTAGLAVGGATAGVALVVGAINAIADRLSATQSRVSESQQFSNTLQQAGGNNPANQKFVRDEFLRIATLYGTAADLENAKAYRTFIMAETARGKPLSAATQSYETRSAAYAGSHMTREEQMRSNLQLQQIASKTRADREDLNTFSEAAPLLIEPIRRAWAARNKHALDGSLEADFRASTTAGNLSFSDFDAGIKLFVKENAEAIKRQSESVDANATRLSNGRYLQQQGLDQNPELIGAINERLKSELALNEAMLPLKKTAIELDIALNRLITNTLGWLFNKDPEANVKKIDSLSPEKPAIDINALTGAEVPSNKPVPDALYGALNKLFSVAAPTTAEPEDPNAVGQINGVWNPLPPRLPVPATASDVQSKVAYRPSAPNAEIPSGNSVVNNNSTDNSVHTSVAPANVTVNITAPVVNDHDLAIKVRDEIGKVFDHYQPTEVH